MKERFFKIVRLMIGFALIGCGTMVTKQIGWLNSWNVLNDGLSNVLPITIGQANTLVGVVIIVIDIIAKEHLGIGTVLNAVCIGMFSDFFINLNASLGLIPKISNFWLQVPLLLVGVALSSVGIYIYMSACMGSGPRDSLMLAITRRLPYPVGVCRMAMEAAAFCIGALLGGEFGIGTFVTVFMGGPCLQLICKITGFNVKTLHNESFAETYAFLKSWWAEKRGAKNA